MSFIFYLIISEPRGLVHYSNGRYDNGGYYNEVLQSYKRTGKSLIFLDISFDLNPPPLVVDPERFYRSGEK